MNFLKKYEKNVTKIINDGEHARRIDDGGSPLKMFFYIHEESDNMMKLHTSKSRGNNAIVANGTEISMLLIYSYRARYQKNRC